jgi:HK97 gp10 family phage protein
MGEFEIDGAAAFTELADDLESMADEVQEAIDGAVEKTALQVERSAKQKAPVDTGNLRASIQTVPDGLAQRLVGTNVEYAPDVEFGTQPHVITPTDAEALRFEGSDGDIVYAKSVDHPGTPAQPFLRPALREHESDLVENIRAAIDDLSNSEF